LFLEMLPCVHHHFGQSVALMNGSGDNSRFNKLGASPYHGHNAQISHAQA
jgi:hypothetical protein